ncbi:MAG: hypothetical protein UW51_C0006G0201 [Candidatus Amesbacteria bacterium GW2011_GWA1_44_24]|nr:MAG: hypothetical protein UW51_C0006G0201 [Candidatus Amesbacteria bacterium GW2011_GWA1_44_24]
MEITNAYFKTTDLCLASYLLAKDTPFTGINKDSSGRATFLFPITDKCRQLVKEFTETKALVEPMAFFSAQKRLKHLIYL